MFLHLLLRSETSVAVHDYCHRPRYSTGLEDPEEEFLEPTHYGINKVLI